MGYLRGVLTVVVILVAFISCALDAKRRRK